MADDSGLHFDPKVFAVIRDDAERMCAHDLATDRLASAAQTLAMLDEIQRLQDVVGGPMTPSPAAPRPRFPDAATRTAAFNRKRVRIWDVEDLVCTACKQETEVWPIYFGNGKNEHGDKEVNLCPDCMMDLAIQIPLKP